MKRLLSFALLFALLSFAGCDKGNEGGTTIYVKVMANGVEQLHSWFNYEAWNNIFILFPERYDNIQVGEMVRVSFDIDAREYQGRWYNSIRAWNVDRNIVDPMMQPAAVPAPDTTPFGAPAPMPTFASVEAEAPFASSSAEEELPF